MRSNGVAHPQPAIDQLATLQKIISEPLRVLEEEWRPVVYHFWIRWNHLLENYLAQLCVRVSEYCNDGLTVEELRSVFSDVDGLELTGKASFASDVFTAIASRVNLRLQRKRTLERQLLAREQAASMAVEAQEARSLVASLVSSFARG